MIFAWKSWRLEDLFCNFWGRLFLTSAKCYVLGGGGGTFEKHVLQFSPPPKKKKDDPFWIGLKSPPSNQFFRSLSWTSLVPKTKKQWKNPQPHLELIRTHLVYFFPVKKTHPELQVRRRRLSVQSPCFGGLDNETISGHPQERYTRMSSWVC